MSKALKAIPLTPAEVDLLAEHELTISQGLQAFVAVGLALVEIRDKKLYRSEFKTFEDYCRNRWDIGARRGEQLMSAAKVAEEMRTTGSQIVVENERQTRALAMIPPHLRDEVIEKLKDAEETVTEQSVTKAVNRLLEDKRREAKEREQSGHVEEDEEEEEAEEEEEEIDETPAERTLRRVAKKVEKERMYLARGLEHLRLAVKDLRKVLLGDMETAEAIQAAREALDTADEVFSDVRTLIAQAEAA